MSPVPQQLLEQGNVLLFVGQRVARSAGGQPIVDHLTAQLIAQGALAGEENLSFPEAAQAYEDAHGRQALLAFALVLVRVSRLGNMRAPSAKSGLAISAGQQFDGHRRDARPVR